MDSNLGGFIKFLEDHDLVEFNIDGDGNEHFTNRMKLQKYVLLAKHLGMPFSYEHDIYLYGPYSNTLIDDCYELARDAGQYANLSADTPDTFRKDIFLKTIRNDPDWLAVAATIIDRNKTTTERTALMGRVCRIRHQVDEEFVTGVMHDLETQGLVAVEA